MEQVVEALAASPARLRGLLGGLGGERARPHPEVGGWAAGDVLLHLRASDAILAPRIGQILARPNVPLADIDERTYAGVLARAEPTVAEQIDAFAARRAELVAILRALRPNDWNLTGQHERRGPVSVRELATWIAEHEAEHVSQIEQALQQEKS
jgi:hypothetical protein